MIVKAFILYKIMLDQLPPIGYYVLFFKHGVSLMMPITSVETLVEAENVADRPDYHKIILTGHCPYREWQLGLNDAPIILLAEFESKDKLDFAVTLRKGKTYMSGPKTSLCLQSR